MPANLLGFPTCHHPQSMKQGNQHETKATLMKKAEESGLSNKSLFGTSNNMGMLRPGDRFYDGWSSFNKVCWDRCQGSGTHKRVSTQAAAQHLLQSRFA